IISSADISMPYSARHAMSACTERSPLSINTPSQSKITRSNRIAPPLRLGLDRDDDDRGVVDGARRQHPVEQPLGGDPRRRRGDLARDLAVGDHVGEAVAAQEKPIAGKELLAEDAEFEPAAA